MVNVHEFFLESNAIEGVYDDSAVEESMRAYNNLVVERELTHKTLKETHEILLEERQPQIAGEYRNVHVRIGNDIPPSPGKVEGLMDKLLSQKPETHIDALEWHIDFEKIHPFQDGNGRIGRLIYLWHMCDIHDHALIFYEKNKDTYYKLFGDDPDVVDIFVELRDS